MPSAEHQVNVSACVGGTVCVCVRVGVQGVAMLRERSGVCAFSKVISIVTLYSK